MATNTENDQQAQPPASPSTAPVADMLGTLDDLLEAAQRVAAERRTTSASIDVNAPLAAEASADSR